MEESSSENEVAFLEQDQDLHFIKCKGMKTLDTTACITNSEWRVQSENGQGEGEAGSKGQMHYSLR